MPTRSLTIRLGPAQVTAQVAYQAYRRGTRRPDLAETDRRHDSRLAISLRELRLTPVFQFTRRAVDDTALRRRDALVRRPQLLVDRPQRQHQGRLHTRIDPRILASQNEFTIQLQLFYF